MDKNLYSLENLYLDTKNNIYKSNLLGIDQNIELAKKLFNQVLDLSTDLGKSKIYNSNIEYLVKFYDLLSQNNMLKKGTDILEYLINKCATHNIVTYHVDPLIMQHINIIYKTESIKNNLINFIDLINKISLGSENKIQKEIPKYYAYIMRQLVVTRNLTESDRNDISNLVIDRVSSFAYLISDVKQIFVESCYYILKSLFYIIIDPESGIPSKIEAGTICTHITTKIYDNNKLGYIDANKCEDFIEILLAVTVFSFYILKCEKLNTNDIVENIIKQTIINIGVHERISLLDLVYKLKSNVWLYYNKIKKRLSDNWEYLPIHEVKTMIMDDSINKFYIFFSKIAIHSLSFASITNDLMENDVFILINDYTSFSSSEIESNINDVYSYFAYDNKVKTQLDTSTFSYYFSNNIIYNDLLAKFKRNELSKLRIAKQKTDIINKNISILRKKYEDQLKDSVFYDVEISGIEMLIIPPINIITTFLSETDIFFGYDDLGKEVLRSIYKAIFDGEKLNTIQLNLGDDEFIPKLVKVIDELSDVSKPLIINRKLTELAEFAYSDIPEKDAVKDFERRCTIKPTSLYLPILITTPDFVFRYKINAISISEVGTDNINYASFLQDIETNDRQTNNKSIYYDDSQVYTINVTNNIFIDLNREELREYISNKYYQLNVSILYQLVKPTKCVSISFVKE